MSQELLTDQELEVALVRMLAEHRAAGRLTAWGRYSYGAPRIVWHEGDTGELSVGAYCSFAVGVEIFLGGEHRTDWISTYPFRAALALPGAFSDGHPLSRGDIIIGNDVWVGREAKIRSGVTVGDGAVLGAAAVVTRPVRPYAVVAGNPARELRRRFPDSVVERLLAIRWWDWPHDEIVANIHLLNSSDLDAFFDYAACRPATNS